MFGIRLCRRFFCIKGNGKKNIASTCGSKVDTVLRLISRNTCVITNFGSPQCIPEDDRAILEWNSNQGQEYILFIRGSAGAKGDYELTITSP